MEKIKTYLTSTNMIYAVWYIGNNSLGLPPKLIEKAVKVDSCNLRYLSYDALMSEKDILKHCEKTHKKLNKWKA